MILRLAFRDIVHDRLLSACLVLAIASIIAPLLILFGLQFGTIETLRNRLVEDPKNREIRPLTTQSFSREWFAHLRATSPEVAFVVPMTRQIAASIIATSANGERREPLSLLATAPGDPLLVENGVAVPEPGSCVLTESAARALEVSVGGQLTFSTQRIVQGRYEQGGFAIRVAGILEERATGLRVAYVPLEVIEAVEDYKDGRAVPAYGWQGELPTAYPVFDGAMVLTPEPLSKLEEVLLINNTGFAQVKALGTEEAARVLGHASRPHWSLYTLTVKQRSATEANLQAVSNKLRGKGAIVVPWIEPLEVVLHGTESTSPVSVRLQVRGDENWAVTGVPAKGTEASARGGEPRTLIVSQDIPLADGPATLVVRTLDRELRLPVLLRKGGGAPAVAEASAVFAGQLNLLRWRNVHYDAQADALLLSRQGYAGFRLYATTIDAVATVQRRLENEGIAVHTERERIGEVRRLDQYTTLIFWLIASVGVVGGISALTASLYASVERKKKELNVLRLLGLLKRELLLFPIAQGLMLSSGALLLAAALFAVVARLINHLFREHLQAAESLCALSPVHFLLLTAGVWGLSVLAATVAALRATRLDPAEALRDE